jgi:uncharacterized protein
MFRVLLMDLERRGTLQIHHQVPVVDGLWEGSELTFGEPVEVDLTLAMTGTGQIVGRGRLRTVLRYACRRCLAEVDRRFEMPLHLAWSPPDELSDEGHEDEGLRVLPETAQELNLGEVIREEILLAAPLYVVCREECKGLCPTCGTDWNEGECECARADPDPRWAALRALERE